MATATLNRKYTTIAELEKSAIGSVWVLNTSDRAGDAGKLLFSVAKLNGNGVDPVRVPKSFIPFDLTEQVPRAQLLASSDFRNTIRKGMVKVLTEEYAQALLGTEEGAEEKRRIDNINQQLQTAIDNAGVAAGDDDEDQFFDPKDLGAQTKKVQQTNTKAIADKSADKVDVKIQNIVANAGNENWTQTSIVNKLRNHGKMSIDDLKFLRAKFTDKPKVVTFLKSVYQSMQVKAKKA